MKSKLLLALGIFMFTGFLCSLNADAQLGPIQTSVVYYPFNATAQATEASPSDAIDLPLDAGLIFLMIIGAAYTTPLLKHPPVLRKV